MTTTRNLENPLFDIYVEAMVPYIQRHQLWHQRFDREWAEKHGQELPSGDEVELDRLSWEVGRSRTALDTLRVAVKDAPDRTEEELKEIEVMVGPFMKRHEVVAQYAWAIPSEEAIDKIVEHSPHGLVEIGAGTGYWARMIRARGIDVRAYDQAPYPAENMHATQLYSPVETGGPEKAALWPKHTLFLCWPPYSDPMAVDALRAYSGDTLLYIGEGSGGCTGDDAFHDELESRWRELEDEMVWLPQWPGIHDVLNVYKRL